MKTGGVLNQKFRPKLVTPHSYNVKCFCLLCEVEARRRELHWQRFGKWCEPGCECSKVAK
jgi:hypothetical protein